MNAGRLDRKIIVEQKTTTTDEFGGNGSYSWSTLATIWAKMDTSLSSEAIAANKIETSYPIKWTVRFTPSITEGMRILYESKYYHIKGIREITRRHLMELQTELIS